MRAWESRGSGPPGRSRAAPLRGSFSLEKRKTGAEPIAAMHHDYDIPGRNRSRIQFKSALPPVYVAERQIQQTYPSKLISVPAHREGFSALKISAGGCETDGNAHGRRLIDYRGYDSSSLSDDSKARKSVRDVSVINVSALYRYSTSVMSF